MKKIGLLLACTVVLSGCTPTNGILKEKDVNTLSYEKVKPLIEEREKIRRIFAGQFEGTLEIFMTAAVDIYSLLAVQANMRFCAKKNIEVPVF